MSQNRQPSHPADIMMMVVVVVVLICMMVVGGDLGQHQPVHPADALHDDHGGDVYQYKKIHHLSELSTRC